MSRSGDRDATEGATATQRRDENGEEKEKSQCTNTLISRRRLLAAAAGAGLGLAVPAAARGDADEPADEPFPKDAAEAGQRLAAGNKRFVAGESIHPRATKEWRQRLTKQQKPFAAVLGCSDSRVPAELVFDQGFGNLFVIRVAGNVFAPDGLGSLEYAWLHLKVPLVLVLGHEGCGAVAAALEARFGQAKEPEAVAALVRRIDPAPEGPRPQAGGRGAAPGGGGSQRPLVDGPARRQPRREEGAGGEALRHGRRRL